MSRARVTAPEDARQAKLTVLNEIGGGLPIEETGEDRWDLGGFHELHVRFASSRGWTGYPFNINSNTLIAQYEVWICGHESEWYFIPMEDISKLWRCEGAYPDRRNPGCQILNIDPYNNHKLGYATGKSKDFTEYFCATL
jgi:hypothetical protein